MHIVPHLHLLMQHLSPRTVPQEYFLKTFSVFCECTVLFLENNSIKGSDSSKSVAPKGSHSLASTQALTEPPLNILTSLKKDSCYQLLISVHVISPKEFDGCLSMDFRPG